MNSLRTKINQLHIGHNVHLCVIGQKTTVLFDRKSYHECQFFTKIVPGLPLTPILNAFKIANFSQTLDLIPF